jgi:hypothetical protein
VRGRVRRLIIRNFMCGFRSRRAKVAMGSRRSAQALLEGAKSWFRAVVFGVATVRVTVLEVAQGGRYGSGDGGNGAGGGGDAADAVVVGVGEIEVASRVNCEAGWRVDGGCRG